MSKTKPHGPLPPLDAAQRYTVNQSCLYLKTSRKSIYAAIARGELCTISQGQRKRKTRDGKTFAGRTFIPGSEIVRLSAAPSVATGGAP